MWNALPFLPHEVSCLKTSLSFVDSVWELFGPLLQGIPLLVLVLWLMQQMGARWWLYVWLAWMAFNLLVLPSRAVSFSPGELFSSARLQHVFSLAADMAQLLIIEAPLINAALGITIRGAGLTRARGGMRGFWHGLIARYRHLGGELRVGRPGRRSPRNFERRGRFEAASAAPTAARDPVETRRRLPGRRAALRE